MKQVKLLLFTSIALVSIFMAGCAKDTTTANKENDTSQTTTTVADETTDSGNENPTEEPTTVETPTEEPTTEEPTTEEPTTVEPTTEEPTTVEPTTEAPTSGNNGDVANLDTQTITYGPGTHVDELNRPVSSVSYQNAYGSYGAYFVKLDSEEVYLTFDLGYEYNNNTPKILDILKEKNVKAVFFPTYSFAVQYPDIIQRIIDEGHVLGNHSTTHPSMPTVSVEQMQNEIMTLHNYILTNYGYKMTLFRPPQGHFSYQSLTVTQNLGYKSVLWSFAYADYFTDNQPDVQWALNNATSKAHPGAIFLLHSVSNTNVAMLGDFIDNLQENYTIGYLQ